MTGPQPQRRDAKWLLPNENCSAGVPPISWVGARVVRLARREQTCTTAAADIDRCGVQLGESLGDKFLLDGTAQSRAESQGTLLLTECYAGCLRNHHVKVD